MEVEAGGQGRFHGWRKIVSSPLAGIDWPPGRQFIRTVTWKDVELHLNGHFKVQVTITNADVEAIAPHILTQRQLIALANLSDEAKISLAKDALAKHSTSDKPNVKILFGMMEAMLTRKEVIALVKLTDDEKIALARETLRDMPFGEVIARLHDQPQEEEEEIA